MTTNTHTNIIDTGFNIDSFRDTIELQININFNINKNYSIINPLFNSLKRNNILPYNSNTLNYIILSIIYRDDIINIDEKNLLLLNTFNDLLNYYSFIPNDIIYNNIINHLLLSSTNTSSNNNFQFFLISINLLNEIIISNNHIIDLNLISINLINSINFNKLNPNYDSTHSNLINSILLNLNIILPKDTIIISNSSSNNNTDTDTRDLTSLITFIKTLFNDYSHIKKLLENSNTNIESYLLPNFNNLLNYDKLTNNLLLSLLYDLFSSQHNYSPHILSHLILDIFTCDSILLSNDTHDHSWNNILSILKNSFNNTIPNISNNILISNKSIIHCIKLFYSNNKNIYYNFHPGLWDISYPLNYEKQIIQLSTIHNLNLKKIISLINTLLKQNFKLDQQTKLFILNNYNNLLLLSDSTKRNINILPKNNFNDITLLLKNDLSHITA